MKCGDQVRVVQIVEQDMLDGDDEFGQPMPELKRMLAFVGRVGRVIERDENGERGGIGQRTGDPLFTVRFRRRTNRVRLEGEVFWTEELRRVAP
jgi:hypothetical protein